jgi:two-component system sensor histidine kinase DegS
MTKVAIIGAGKGGRALLEMFAGDPTVTIRGVADVNPWAPGLELARRLNIPVATDLRGLIADPRLDLVIDVTGSPEVQRAILELKPAATEVMGGASARHGKQGQGVPAAAPRRAVPLQRRDLLAA